MTLAAPTIVHLQDDDIQSILARNHVGRLAFVTGGEVDIRPLHYVHSKGVIYCRTSPETRLSTTALPSTVAFEVDEIVSVQEWKSVIARGEGRVLSRVGSDSAEWTKAVGLLRLVVKHAFDEDDPFPARSVVVRIAVEGVTGVACS